MFQHNECPVTEHKVGAICAPSGGGKGDCGDTNAVCSAAGKCECKDGFIGPVGGDCGKSSFIYLLSFSAMVSIFIQCLTFDMNRLYFEVNLMTGMHQTLSTAACAVAVIM